MTKPRWVKYDAPGRKPIYALFDTCDRMLFLIYVKGPNHFSVGPLGAPTVYERCAFHTLKDTKEHCVKTARELGYYI